MDDYAMFEWDEAKRRANIAKHGVDFVEAENFDFETAVHLIDRRRDYGESRKVATGLIGDRLHVLIYTIRGENTRIISLRKANDREYLKYDEAD